MAYTYTSKKTGETKKYYYYTPKEGGRNKPRGPYKKQTDEIKTIARKVRKLTPEQLAQINTILTT